MASDYKRVGAGQWKNIKTGKVVNSKTDPGKSGTTDTTTTGKGKKPKLSPDDQKALDTYRAGIDAGKGVVNDVLGKDFTLGRVDDTPAPGSSAEDVGKLLDKLYTESENAGTNTDDQNHAISTLKGLSDTAGTRTDDVKYGIDSAKSDYEKSKEMDPNVQKGINYLDDATQGLDSADSQSYWEYLTKDLNRSYAGALSDASAAAASNGISNPAVSGQIADNFLQGNLDARNTLAVQNIGIKNAAKGAFADYVRQVHNDMTKNTSDALSLYDNTVNTAETNEFNQKLSSGQAYNSAAEANSVNNRNDKIARLNAFGNELARTRTDNLNRVLSNINTLASEISTKTGIVMGVPEYLAASKAQRDANALANKTIDMQGKLGSSGGGKSGGGGPVNSPVAGDSFDAPGGAIANPNNVSGINTAKI